MKRKYLLLASATLVFAIIHSCKESTGKIIITEYEPFKAIDMPSNLANGDAFPTDSTTIDVWLSNPNVDAQGVQNDPNIIAHTWGLWQSLTEMTDQKFEGRRLRRFETWYTPQDVMKAMELNIALADLKRNDGNLQFRKKFKFGHDNELNTAAGDISGKVKYSPSMAEHALKEKYFDTVYLKSKIVVGEINSLAFKPNDVMLKPIYRVLTDLSKAGKDMYYFDIWGGKQDGGKPNNKFSKVIKVITNLDSPMLETINDTLVYSIKNFIHHKMSEQEAYTYNHSTKEGFQFKDTAKVGDPIILLGMHASTRETRRWTWQSFYWTENPNNPVFPSSKTIAAGRNSLELPAPLNNYAASIAYSMMSPALPFESKDGKAIDIVKAGVSPVYGLNPYIEGTFTEKDVFPNQNKLFKNADYEKQYYKGNVDGITSNCMSCHSQSYYDGTGTSGNFLADQYVNRNAPWFKGAVQLDFAWSLFPGFEPPPSKVTEPNKK